MSSRRPFPIPALLGLVAIAGLAAYLVGLPAVRSRSQDEAARSLPPSAPVQRFSGEPQVTLFVKQTQQRRTLPIEEYVAGVVAGEMWERWPRSAYAAQAIVARTFTLEFMARGGTRPLHGTDLSTDPEEAQAYNPGAITEEIRRAVADTRGQVLTYGGRYVRAWFHAYSGGRTTTPEEGLGVSVPDAPYLKPVRLPANDLAPPDLRSWRAEFSAAELRSALARAGVDVGAIRAVRIAGRGPTGRITRVEIEGSQGRSQLSGNELRVALGAQRMKSTLVDTFQFSGGRLAVAGTGSGHGVGLSQWDALRMARQGQTPQEILRTFYPGARIEKLW